MMLDNENIKYATPESQGVPSEAILNFFETLREKDLDGAVDLHSFRIIRNDRIIAEGCGKPFAMNRYHRIYSAAKGIVAIGVLLALQEGILQEDERLVDIFPDHVPENLSEKMSRVTVFHLLTMNSGHDSDPCAEMFASDDWIKTFMSIEPVYEPGTWFCYNNGIPHILAAIVERKAGEDIFHYMRPRFLDPLGIQILCRTNKQGEQEPSTVCVTQDDLTKIGYVFLKNGRWKNRQLIDEKWVHRFGQYHVPTASPRHGFRQDGYGFQVWKMPCEGYVFHGGNDNLACIYTEADLLFTCLACNKDKRVDIQQVFHDTVYKQISSYPLKENPRKYKKLQRKLSEWNLAPVGCDRSGITEEISGRTYVFNENPLGCEQVTMNFREEDSLLEIVSRQNGRNHRLLCGFNGEWPTTEDYVLIPPNLTHGNFIDGENPAVNMASAVWRDQSTLRIYGRSFGRIESDKFTFSFDGDQVTVSILTPALALPGIVTDRSKGQYVLKGRWMTGQKEAVQ